MFGITEPTGSHIPQLEEAARAATGLVIEHGAGLYSTVLLSRLGKRVLCCESNAAWREWAAFAYEGRADVTDSLDATIARLPDASLVFIDGPESERNRLVTASIAARVPAIVAHDTHPRVWGYYGWRPEHFSPAGYTVTDHDYLDKYRTTVWRR